MSGYVCKKGCFWKGQQYMPGDFVRSTERFPMLYFEIYDEEIHGKRFRNPDDDQDEREVFYDPWKLLKERRIING